MYTSYASHFLWNNLHRERLFSDNSHKNVVCVNHNGKTIKGVFQKPAFRMAYTYISVTITGLLHQVFSQSSRIPCGIKFLL